MADAAMQKVKDMDSKMNMQLKLFGEEIKEERHISLCGGIKRRAGWLDRWRAQDAEKKAKLKKLVGSGKDLKNASVLITVGADARVDARVRLYAKLLQDEVWDQARVKWEILENASGAPDGRTAIRLGIDAALADPAKAAGSGAAHEAYRIDNGAAEIKITGASQRGLLFGCGRLLREMLLHYEEKYSSSMISVCALTTAAPVRVLFLSVCIYVALRLSRRVSITLICFCAHGTRSSGRRRCETCASIRSRSGRRRTHTTRSTLS